MAKSLRSKIKKRFRTLKRQYIEQIKGVHDKQDLSNRLQATMIGRSYQEPEKKNAFKYPKDPNATFPQYKKQPLVDFRSSSIPFAGTEFSGAYRKKIKENEVNETKEIEIEDIQEESQQDAEESQNDEIQDNDLEKDFDKFKISNKKKRIKKNSQEKEIIYLQEKKVKKIKEKKKKERSCRKSRKNMNF